MSDGISGKMEELPYIIAVDFDGTIVSDAFPKIGESNPFVIDLIRKAQLIGIKVILWTCRTGSDLEEAINYCYMAHGIIFDSVNSGIPEVVTLFGGDARKVYANEYWDDKLFTASGPMVFDGEFYKNTLVRIQDYGI